MRSDGPASQPSAPKPQYHVKATNLDEVPMPCVNNSNWLYCLQRNTKDPCSDEVTLV